MIPTSYFVILSAILFTTGVVGVLVRRNAIVLFMSVELMLNAANLALVAFSRELASGQRALNAIDAVDGQVIVFFVITVAAAEVAVGLALLVAIFRTKRTADVDEVSILRG